MKVNNSNFNQTAFLAENDSARQTKKSSGSTAAPTEDYTVKSGDTLSKISEKRGISQHKILDENPQVKNPNKIYAGQHLKLTQVAGKTVVYTIKTGDKLADIARKHGTSVGDIMRANRGEIHNSNLIFPGQQIRVPVKNGVPAQRPNQPVTNAPSTKQPTLTPPAKTPVAIEPQTTNGTQKAAGSRYVKIDLNDFLSVEKGSQSKAAIVIGNAEGTRKPDGGFTPAYKGHTDPGDGRGNKGSFSYAPRGASDPIARTPEEADRIQLGRMRPAMEKYMAAAKAAGIDPNDSLTAAAYFDALNQSPLAANKMLKQTSLLKEKGVSPETIKEWRFRGYVNVDTGKRWEYKGKTGQMYPAGGGLTKGAKNETEAQQMIQRDQNRRVSAMLTAMEKQGMASAGKSGNAGNPGVTNRPQSTPIQKPEVSPSDSVKRTGMPETGNMTEAQKFDTYADFVSQNGNAKAKNDLANGQRVILGLRQPTNTRTNNDKGAYDDRIVVMWKDSGGKKHVKEVTNANTEPASYYEDTKEHRLDPKRERKIIKTDANGDGRGDLGRLTTATHEYTKSYSKGFGIEQEPGKNILRPTVSNRVERDSNHNGGFDSNDATHNKRNMTDRGTMYFHRGGKGDFTGSAGCQTMPQKDFNEFWQSLGNQDKFQYVLVEVK